MKKIKDSLYHILVETNVHVKYHHQKYVSDMKRRGRYSLVLSLLYLAKLTVLIRVLRLKKYRGQTGKPYFAGSESELSHKISPEDYAARLMAYDINLLNYGQEIWSELQVQA